ncbi:hypothetical protein Tco_0913499 [Tanacetum coccineum]
MDEKFTTTAYPSVQENLKLPTEDQVILEEPTSSARTLSSLQNLDKELSFTNQFLVEKSQEDEPDKSNTEAEVSQAVDEIVTDAVDWAMQAPLRARFRDLPTKYLELDYSNQRLADQEEAHKKRQKIRDAPRSPPGSPPSQPPPPAGASGAPGRDIPSSSKTTASAQQSMASTIPDTIYELTGITVAQVSSPTKSLMHDDSTPDEQVQSSNDEDTKNDQIPEADTRKDWWKPLPEEERPATLEPAWTILPSKMEECHKMLTDQVDWANPEGDQVRINVNRPLPLGGPSGHVTIQTEFFFNKDLEYLSFGNKGSMPVLSISKMKAARYPDFGLELLVPE